MKRLLTLRRCEAGGTAIELAILALVIIPVLLGLLELGRALYVRSELSSTVEFAARRVPADPQFPTSNRKLKCGRFSQEPSPTWCKSRSNAVALRVSPPRLP